MKFWKKFLKKFALRLRKPEVPCPEAVPTAPVPAPHPESTGDILRESSELLRELDAILATGSHREATAYWQTLPIKSQKCLTYELAKRTPSQSTSGFHGFGSDCVIRACGWADYEGEWYPGSGLHSLQGVAFRIDRECFPEGPVRIFYLDEDDFGNEDALRLIRQYSSGIRNVHTERRVCPGWGHGVHTQFRERTLIVFDLDEAAVRPTVTLSGQPVPTGQVGSYIFVLPRCGEFYCVLGELREEELIPLHRDDFCMK